MAKRDASDLGQVPGQIVKEPQGTSVCRQLLTALRQGELMPGGRLREIDLAERLGVSRTPIREAIRLLEVDGLVTHAPRQGAIVRAQLRRGDGAVRDAFRAGGYGGTPGRARRLGRRNR